MIRRERRSIRTAEAPRFILPNNRMQRAPTEGEPGPSYVWRRRPTRAQALADGGNIALTAENADDCGTTWEDLWGPAGPRVLDGIRPSDFEVIDVGGREKGYDCVRNPARGP